MVHFSIIPKKLFILWVNLKFWGVWITRGWILTVTDVLSGYAKIFWWGLIKSNKTTQLTADNICGCCQPTTFSNIYIICPSTQCAKLRKNYEKLSIETNTKLLKKHKQKKNYSTLVYTYHLTIFKSLLGCKKSTHFNDIFWRIIWTMWRWMRN